MSYLSIHSFKIHQRHAAFTTPHCIPHPYPDPYPSVCSPSPTPCRDQANALLNTTRASYEPNALLAALSPRILDIPERMKTALMQYLGVIVPYCTDYFSVPQNTGTRRERGRGGGKGRRIYCFLSDSSDNVPLCSVTLLLHLYIVCRFWE